MHSDPAVLTCDLGAPDAINPECRANNAAGWTAWSHGRVIAT